MMSAVCVVLLGLGMVLAREARGAREPGAPETGRAPTSTSGDC